MALEAKFDHALSGQRAREESGMTPSTARDYWVKPFDFRHREVTCVVVRNCSTSAAFQIGWRFDKRVKGVLTPIVACRSACEHHARMFAFKKGIQFPRAGV